MSSAIVLLEHRTWDRGLANLIICLLLRSGIYRVTAQPGIRQSRLLMGIVVAQRFHLKPK
jgi:hypothetical protein